MKSGSRNGIEPCQQIRHLRGIHAPAFLLVEENHGAERETFASRCRRSGLCIARTKRASISFRLQFAFESAIEQNEEPEALLRNCSSMADPRIRFRARRTVQPIASEREGFP